MGTSAQLTPTNKKLWMNRHNTFSQKVDNLFEIANGNTGDLVTDYNATTDAIREIIRKAIQQKKRVRALGGGWSFSKVAATDGWLLDTKQLNFIFEVNAPSVSVQYTGNKNQLLFAQCGNSIQELNTYLRKNRKSLRTCGASNGQTIVGAFSTGTHGSAIDAGSTPDFVVGMHIITGPDTHIWLEKASYPVAADAMVQRLKTKLVRNDDLFNAALVSFGSFGFIHGVMIETEEIYLLECYRERIPINSSLEHMMETLDFTNAQLVPHGNERPFHFQIVVNQYDMKGGAYATLMYKRPFTTNYSPPVASIDKAGPGDDMPTVLGKLTDIFPFITPLIVNQGIKRSFLTFSNVLGTLGEIFTNNDIRGKVVSTAIGIPVSFANEVNILLIELNKAHGPFSGILSYRYVRKCPATLGFAKFDFTCIVELDGVESVITRKFYELVWSELERRNIPYTFHWGKINNLDPVKMRKMYGASMDEWIEARNELMHADALEVFNNQVLADYGLDEITSKPRPV